MPDILVDGVDGEVVERLLARAAANGRTLGAEVRAILTEVAESDARLARRQAWLRELDGIQASYGDQVLPDSTASSAKLATPAESVAGSSV